jgi:GNAT superfamily N-acetyltransferase
VDESELIDEVVVKPRSAHVVFPGVQCIDRPDWHQLITPTLKQGGLNGVSLAILDEDEVDQVIDETIRGYEELGVKFRWTVGPDSRPLDLGKRLEARGLRPILTAAMAAEHDGVPKDRAVEVELVGPDTVDEFNRVMSEGWSMTSKVLSEYNAHVLRESPDRNPFFIARIDGVGVGVASYFAFPRSAYLVGGVVLPEYRGRGVYRALVRARQEHAWEAGISLATCHAMAHSSAPILEKLGFKTICQFTSYTN